VARLSYHGSEAVKKGRLEGATDYSDCFYFFCPKCPDRQIMRILEYTEHVKQKENEYNEQCKSKAKYGFTLVLKLHCENCGHSDLVRLSNIGWQKGKHSEVLRRL